MGRGNADRFEGALLIYCIFKRVVIFKGGQIMLKNIDAVNIVPISAFEHDEVTCANVNLQISWFNVRLFYHDFRFNCGSSLSA